jgi:hypothetical protein
VRRYLTANHTASMSGPMGLRLIKGFRVRLVLVAAAISMAEVNVHAASVSGTWEYQSPDVSMRLRLDEHGTCRVTARLTRGTSVDALCTYTVETYVVTLYWPGIPVKGHRVPETLRLHLHPGAEILEMEGEPRHVLTPATFKQ